MKTLLEIKESATVVIVMFVIFLPLRVLFVRYIADNWLGSLGLISAMMITILILAKKDKLGKFGRMYLRQLFKIHRGKRKYFAYFMIGFTTIFFGTLASAIDNGKTNFSEEVALAIQFLPQEMQNSTAFLEAEGELTGFTIDGLLDMNPANLITGMILMFIMPILNFDLFSIVFATADHMANGWILHFSTIIFIEELEVIGIMIYTRFFLIRKDLKLID